MAELSIEPLYTPANCSSAYQLNWSLSVFGKTELPDPADTRDELGDALANDGLRILEARFKAPNVAQFFLSSQPPLQPTSIVRLVKGRWQHVLRPQTYIRFRRNFRLTSLGSANASTLEKYIARQAAKHPMADPAVQTTVERLQFHDATVDVTAIQRNQYGEYRYALHVVIGSEEGWHEVRSSVLEQYRRTIIAACRKHGWSLARIGLLSDHVHILLSGKWNDAPEAIALSLMNNLAYSQGMRRVFRSYSPKVPT